MFIPFGVLLPMFGKTMSHVLIALPIALACSVSIEALQLKYQLGFCQLDDVGANSVGFLIGFLIFLVIRDVYLFVVMLFRLFVSIAKGGRSLEGKIVVLSNRQINNRETRE